MVPARLGFEALLCGLKAAGEDTRLRILALLAGSELTVSDLTTILGQSQPRISRHLKLLFEAELLERYREGAWVFYVLARTGPAARLVEALLHCVDTTEPVFARDAARLDEVRAERARAAQDYFASVAADWDRLRALHVAEGEVDAAIAALLGEGPIDAHLDVGTGTGQLLIHLAGRTRRSVGVDLSHDMLSLARANIEKAGLRHAQVRPGDVHALPFEAASFDLVTLHQVLHFLDEPQRALKEAVRVLRPGGRLLIVDFAPHELEFLRDQHAHRRLGFAPDLMGQWLGALGLAAPLIRNLPPHDIAGGALTVSIYMAQLAPAA